MVHDTMNQGIDFTSFRFEIYMPAIYNGFRCMSSKIFVGGLSYGVDDQTLRESFATFGDVMEARIINDRETGRSRGFGFVTFASEAEANAAVQAMIFTQIAGYSHSRHDIHTNRRISCI